MCDGKHRQSFASSPACTSSAQGQTEAVEVRPQDEQPDEEREESYGESRMLLRTGRTQTMKIQSDSLRFIPSPDVASSVHENGIVLLHICSGQMFASNGTGARIWSGLEERQSTETIVSEISTDYEIDWVTARSHVERFLIELERQNLIQREMGS